MRIKSYVIKTPKIKSYKYKKPRTSFSFKVATGQVNPNSLRRTKTHTWGGFKIVQSWNPFK